MGIKTRAVPKSGCSRTKIMGRITIMQETIKRVKAP
jgi:hypothetical protein